MTIKNIKSFTTRIIPAKNEFWLVLELDDGTRPNGLRMQSAADLAAVLDILTHAHKATFDVDTKTIETSFINSADEA